MKTRAYLIAVLVVALIALASACSEGGYKTADNSSLLMYPDTSRGVACYKLRGRDPMSCVVVGKPNAEATP